MSSAVLAATSATSASASVANTPTWSQIALSDLEAARQIIRSSHPGAATTFGDEAFIERDSQAYSRFVQLANSVDSYAGYQAIIKGYAVAFGDSHIFPTFTRPVEKSRWPGFLAIFDGQVYRVIGSTVTNVSDGDRLVSCDGEPIAAFARSTMGQFERSWAWTANQIKASPFLLIDRGNPFIAYPSRCMFEKDDLQYQIRLHYRPTETDPAYARTMAQMARPTGHWIERVPGNGVWLRLSRLTDEAHLLVSKLEQVPDTLRSANYVVIDVRGNGGGNSEIAERLAALLSLPDARQTENDDAVHWRLSDGNIEQFEQYLADESISEETRQEIAEFLELARAAFAQGEEFYPGIPANMAARRPAIKASQVDSSTQSIVLVTDHFCFSSCLILAERFIAAGALHVGGTTDGDSWFTEARRTALPSGYATFSTMMSVNFGLSRDLGPYVPQFAFDGELSDDEAVQSWVISMLGR